MFRAPKVTKFKLQANANALTEKLILLTLISSESVTGSKEKSSATMNATQNVNVEE